MRRQRGVVVEQLRVADHAVERRAQLVAQRRDVAALGLVGGVGRGLGALQLGVGLAVRFDLLRQPHRLLAERLRLPVALLLRDAAALARQHRPPADDAAGQQQHREHADDGLPQRRRRLRRRVAQHPQLLLIQQRADAGQQQRHRQHQRQPRAEPAVHRRPQPSRQQRVHRVARLRREARVGLAEVAAAGVQRAAQRADRALVGRAVRHVRAFVFALADRAAQRPVARGRPGLEESDGRLVSAARHVVAALRRPRDQRRRDEGGDQRDQRRERLRQRAERAQVRRDAQHRRRAHRAHAHRVDVVQIGAPELDAARRQPQRLVDDEVGHHRHQPRDREVGVEPEHLAEHGEDVELHQHQRDGRVERDPDHATRVAVRQPREEVRPGERTGVGIGDVDLELRQHDEGRRRRHRHAGAAEDRVPGREVHLVRVDRAIQRHRLADRDPRQQRAAQHLEHARQHPARAADRDAPPPAAPVLRGARRHEAQVVGLLAHLRHQRDAHRHRAAELQQVERAALPVLACVRPQARERVRVRAEDVDVGQHQHRDPQRLRPDLQAADGRHAVRHQRQHDNRADQVAPGRRDVERQIERVGHHGGLQREEDEREARVDQRGDRRAEVAEAGAAREQVHVQAVTGRIDRDRPAGQRDDQSRRQDGPERVDEAVLDQERRADRLQHQERRGAERGVGHAQLRPLAERLRRVSQRVVLQRFLRHPAVVVAPHLHHALERGRRGRDGIHGGVGHGIVMHSRLVPPSIARGIKRAIP